MKPDPETLLALAELQPVKGHETQADTLGQKLVSASFSEQFTAQRGTAARLLPYLRLASRRMSARQMSKWLQGQGVKLSPVTISKALRGKASQ